MGGESNVNPDASESFVCSRHLVFPSDALSDPPVRFSRCKKTLRSYVPGRATFVKLEAGLLS